MHFSLSTGMRVWPIFGTRLVRSLWSFRRWIPSEKSHKMNYSLGLFRAADLEVILYGGVMRHVDPTWHAYVALGHMQLASSAWHVGHVISSSTYFVSTILTLRASYMHPRYSIGHSGYCNIGRKVTLKMSTQKLM